MNAPETIIPAEAPPAQEDKRAAVPVGKRVRRLVMQLGPSRMAATNVVLPAAILIARFSWQLPLINAAERALYDARATLMRSEEHTSELQSLMRRSYTDFCLKKQ